MNTELTPKQQTSELIRAAERILIMTGSNPSNDQVVSAVALESILAKLGKQPTVVISDSLPRVAQIIDTSHVARDLEGLRDFIIKVAHQHGEAGSLHYHRGDDGLEITVVPRRGGFKPEDVSFAYGAYHFDLVVVLGVASLDRLDRIYQQNPTLFDDLQVVNIDFHRSNQLYAGVNLVDFNASCISEMLIALIESLGQGMITEEIATALLAGIMSSTDRFTAPHTTAKCMTMAAQLMAAGAEQQKIVRTLYGERERTASPRPRDGERRSAERYGQIAPVVAKSEVKATLVPTVKPPQPEVAEPAVATDVVAATKTEQPEAAEATETSAAVQEHVTEPETPTEVTNAVAEAAAPVPQKSILAGFIGQVKDLPGGLSDEKFAAMEQEATKVVTLEAANPLLAEEIE